MTTMSGSTPWPSANHVALRVVHAEGRHGDAAAVDERRRPADADEPAPRARADERAEPGLAEVEREGVAARSAPAVDQHDLGPAVRDRRPLPARAVAHGPVARASAGSAAR